MCRYDVETGRLVRQLRGHSDRITDLSISSDGRWLLAASMDAHLRVYDIPSARLLQVCTGGDGTVMLRHSHRHLIIICDVHEWCLGAWTQCLAHWQQVSARQLMVH